MTDINKTREEDKKDNRDNNINNNNIITAEKEAFIEELRQKTKKERPLEAGRQKTSISINIEKLRMLKDVMIRQQSGIVLALEDFNKMFGANLTTEIQMDNSKFYNYKKKINRLTKDEKDKRGIWLENEEVEGYVGISLKE